MDGEPGGLQSMGSRRVRHDWVTSLSLFTFMHWRRKWLGTLEMARTLSIEKNSVRGKAISVLAWRILGSGEPGGLPSMGWHRVGHDWSDLAAAAAALVTLICLVALSEVPPFLNSRILSFTYLFIAQTSWRSNTLSMLRAAIITYISWYLWIWVVDIKSSILASSEVNGTSTCL